MSLSFNALVEYGMSVGQLPIKLQGATKIKVAEPIVPIQPNTYTG